MTNFVVINKKDSEMMCLVMVCLLVVMISGPALCQTKSPEESQQPAENPNAGKHTSQ